MKKIMFNDKYGLTQTVLNGRKTQTRWIVPQSVIDVYDEWRSDVECIAKPAGSTIEPLCSYLLRKSRFYVGEVVAVAQSYNDCGYKCFHYRDTDEFMYIVKDNKEISICPAGVRNKMFVAPSLMPHQIRITDVRVEKLQDISDEDCIKEGVRKVINENGIYVQYYVGKGDNTCSFENPREAFAHLINKVSRKDVWKENPYVFVYDFELVK